MKTKMQSNVTVAKKLAVSSLSKANMIAPHGKSSPAPGGSNYKKTDNVLGVSYKAKY